VEVSLFFKEIEKNYFKISLRSKGKVNVAHVAEQFDGGGHHNAAGMKFKGNSNQIKEQLIKLIEDLIEDSI